MDASRIEAGGLRLDLRPLEVRGNKKLMLMIPYIFNYPISSIEHRVSSIEDLL